MLIKKVKIGPEGQRIRIGNGAVVVDIQRCGPDGVRLAILADGQQISVYPTPDAKQVEQ